MSGSDSKGIIPGDFDRFLLRKLKLRDETAFDHIYRRWGKPLYRFVLKIIGSHSAAEDICQETFAKLWLACDSIDPDKNIKTYLFLISRQLTLNYIRDRKRRETFFPNPTVDEPDHISPDMILEDRELESLTEEAIGKLPEQMRRVFGLFYYQNMSNKQIASLLDMSPNYVAVQIHKARIKLEKEILSATVAATTLSQ